MRDALATFENLVTTTEIVAERHPDGVNGTVDFAALLTIFGSIRAGLRHGVAKLDAEDKR